MPRECLATSSTLSLPPLCVKVLTTLRTHVEEVKVLRTLRTQVEEVKVLTTLRTLPPPVSSRSSTLSCAAKLRVFFLVNPWRLSSHLILSKWLEDITCGDIENYEKLSREWDFEYTDLSHKGSNFVHSCYDLSCWGIYENTWVFANIIQLSQWCPEYTWFTRFAQTQDKALTKVYCKPCTTYIPCGISGCVKEHNVQLYLY